ncbi:uncharacterized protein MONBRDRAFT_10565 [Monosiga brevicollis MX1]|uniref:SH2 domain-containing protein n=1 Tax=Monosiga brevicollis TaxID=81824 RepID=A9V6R6_MONBE|nr:uncharacterized protein MONBRDRAFT_10565 [Monosiga brevicollis MX1]EDQ86852.1 predicted protein [Monosiga brevicollis MX1]|eukprot:XP_001748397.1 hypothetical protein [Monosiga brevicollis MX1]
MALQEEDIEHLIREVPAYMPQITKARAREVLANENSGTYLLRFSANSQAIVLTMTIGGKNRHFVLEEDDNRNYTFDFEHSEPTIQQLLNYVEENGFLDEQGVHVRPSRASPVAVEQHLFRQPWYFDDIDRDTADTVLSSKPIGTFLIRTNRHGNLTLSSHAKQRVLHIPLNVERGGKYYVGDMESCPSVQEMVYALANKYKKIETDKYGQVEASKPLDDTGAAAVALEVAQRAANREQAGFKPNRGLDFEEQPDDNLLHRKEYRDVPCFGCYISLDVGVIGSVLIHYVTVIAEILLLYTSREDTTILCLVAALIGVRVWSFVVIDYLTRVDARWLYGLLDLRLVQLVVFYLSDPYNRKNHVRSRINFLRLWQAALEASPILMVATYLNLRRVASDDLFDLFEVVALAAIAAGMFIAFTGSFLQDYLTTESQWWKFIFLPVYAISATASRALIGAAAFMAFRWYILVGVAGGLAILEIVTIALLTPTIEGSSTSVKLSVLRRALFGLLTPMATTRSRIERLRHGLIQLTTAAVLLGLMVGDDRLGDDQSTLYMIVFYGGVGLLALQLLTFLAFVVFIPSSYLGTIMLYEKVPVIKVDV